MAYTVPNMKLIPQDKNWSCWYASAQMIINWRREKTQSSEMGIIDPSEDDSSEDIYKLDKGIGNGQIISFAKKLGLVAVPPLSPSEDAIENWLRRYGPLWVNGKTHIVVIAGIKNGNVLVYDPSPLNKGKVEWRSLSGWYIGSSVDSRDTSNAVQTVFLHCP